MDQRPPTSATHGTIRLDQRTPVPLVRQARRYAHLAVPRGGGDALTPWVVYGQGRSGSTLLGELVGQHPQTTFEDEILYRPVVASLAWALASRARARGLAYGFHVKPYQLSVQHGVVDQHRWLAHLRGRGWLIIHLQRRNALRQALSSALVAHGDQSFLRGGQADRRRPIEVDPQKIVDAVDARTLVRTQEFQAIAGLDPLRVTYEDDLVGDDAHQATASRIFAAIGLDDAPVRTTLRPTARDPREQFTNWDAIRQAVLDSAYSHLLAEVER